MAGHQEQRQQREWAKGRDWWQTAEKPDGGFVLLGEQAVHRAWDALRDGRIELRDLRLWLASFEARARRCKLRPGTRPRYGEGELADLAGCPPSSVRAALRRLERAGLGTWTAESVEPAREGRPLPVPRPWLRELCRVRGRAVLATALGHVVRCLYYRGGRCVSGGYCKSSWVAERFGVAPRAVKEARSAMVAAGRLRVLAADQRRLNRFGAPVVVDLGRLEREGRASCAVRKSAPPRVLSTAGSAPPKEHEYLSYRRSEHQNPGAAPARDGASRRTRGGVAAAAALAHVDAADLRCTQRLVTLFGEAHRRGWVRRCEADKLAFFAAAEHALRVGTTNPPGLFAWLVRRGVSVCRGNDGTGSARTYVTHGDEDRARRRIAAHRERFALKVGSARCAASDARGEEPFPFLAFPPGEEPDDLPAEFPLPISWLKGLFPAARERTQAGIVGEEAPRSGGGA